MDNKLVQVVEESGLAVTKSEVIIGHFTSLLEEVKVLELTASTITVTDVSQVKEMGEARAARLQLAKIRVSAEKVRVKLKEDSLREGKFIDGVANVIKGIIVPVEKRLDEQEKFAINKETERLDLLFSTRVTKLTKYIENISPYNLRSMTSKEFNVILRDVKRVYEAEIAANKQIEADRIKEEKRVEAEAEKNRVENIRLKKQADDLLIQRAKKDAAAAKKQEIADALQAKKDLAIRRKQVAAEIKIQKAKDAQDKAEAKLANERRIKREAKAKAKAEAEEVAAADKEVARQAKLAPEKEKLEAFAENMRKIPAVSLWGLSDNGKRILEDTEVKLLHLADEFSEAIKKL